MRNTIKPVVLLLACSLGTASVFAQSGKSGVEQNITKDETVIIKKEKGDGRTVIEIKDGSVYVNGEAIVTVHDADAAKIHKKVIIEGNSRGGEPFIHGFGFNDEDMDNDAPARGPRKAMLGVMTDPKSERIGALVKNVTPGSAAEKAGLQSGDVITRIDGKAIKDAGMLVTEIMAHHEPGDKVSINYERDGKERIATATLQPAQPQTAMRSYHFGPGDVNGDMPNSMFKSFPFLAGDDMAAASPKLGVSAEDRADGEGVRVLSVKPGSPAATAGIKEGDVITRVGDDKVSSVDELQMNLRDVKGGDKVKLEYQRGGRMVAAEVSLPKAMKRKDL